MPEYTGTMTAWHCTHCRGTTWYKYDVRPPSTTCLMMGCGGTLRRAPELDYEVPPPTAKGPSR